MASNNIYHNVCNSASTTTAQTTSPYPFSIPSYDKIDRELEKRKKEEKMRLKVNRKAMFSKKGR